MNNEAYEELAPFVSRAARIVARKWPGVADADDIEQNIWVRLLESPGSVDKLIELDDEKRDNGLQVIGHQIASMERDEHAIFAGNVFYGTKDVRKILDRVTEERTLTLTDTADLGVAMELLRDDNKKYHDIIVSEFWFGDPIHGHSQELTRAVDRLTVLMNRVHRSNRFGGEYVGTRKVVSNAQANRDSSVLYDGYSPIGVGFGNG